MKVGYLPKLLLQHDDSPYFENNFNFDQRILIKACEECTLAYCVHPRGTEIAIALGQRIVLIGASSTPEPPRFFTPTHSPEAVTSIAWLWSFSTGDSCLAVGTSHGFLQLHSSEGTLIHRQELHDTAVNSIYVRWSGTGIDPDDAAEEVTITFTDAVVRFPSYEIWPIVRWYLRANEGSGSWWGHNIGHAPRITPSKWDLKGVGPRAAAACVGSAPSSLTSLLTQRQEPHRLLIFTAGVEPPLASFVVEEMPSGGLVSMVAGLATASAAGLIGKAKGFLPGRLKGSGSTQNEPETAGISNLHSPKTCSPSTGPQNSTPPAGRKREKLPGVTARLDVAVWDDEKRRVVQVSMSPCCRWALCGDTLGRVLLVDVHSCVILKILKGYREAQATWFVPEPGASALVLVYAPKRGVIELWKPHEGVRIGSLPNAPQRGVVMVQGAMPMAVAAGRQGHGGWRKFQPNECYMLDLEALVLENLTPKLVQLAVAAAS